MSQLIGACGLNCNECSAYKATQANDLDAIMQTIAEWKIAHGGDFKPEEVWCDGCMSPSDRKCSHTNVCHLRACVVARGLANCAECNDYGCEKMTAFVGDVPQMRDALAALRSVRGGK
jgi:hypothetical protein